MTAASPNPTHRMGLTERGGGVPDDVTARVIDGAAAGSAAMVAAAEILASAAPRARCSAFAQSAHSLALPVAVGRSHSRHFIASAPCVK